MSNALKVAAAMGAVDKLYVDDVFSTFLYNGNSSTQTITNGIDLAGKGGMVWIKGRTITSNNVINDTIRNAGGIHTNSTQEQASLYAINSYNTNGFTLNNTTGNDGNASGQIYASWTFRKAPKFFDVVTWSGDNTTRNISHALGTTPGMIVVKRTDTASTQGWVVWHTSTGGTNNLLLNGTAAAAALVNGRISAATSTTFTVQAGSTNNADVNATGGTYVAYLFAYDTSTDGIIQCGSFTTDGSGETAAISLGWEPQAIILKKTNAVGDWSISDILRGMPGFINSGNAQLLANTTGAETTVNTVWPVSTGFDATNLSASSTYIYLAIRRSNKPPTVGTQVFHPTTYTGTNADNRLINTTIAPDMVWLRKRSSSTMTGLVVADRMRGNAYLLTGATAAEVTAADAMDAQLVSAVEYGNAFSSMSGVYVGNNIFGYDGVNIGTTASDHIALAFKRAKGFFDIVCYTGTGVARTVDHGLGAVPELMIVRGRDARSWYVYCGNPTEFQVLNIGIATATGATFWDNTAPTSSVFSVDGSNAVNQASIAYVAYLFATLPGISKVGTYTGNGGTQTIDCGFTTGARFVMIKRTDTTGDWYVFDTARTYPAGNDYHLSANSTAAEVVTTDDIDADNNGFIVNQNVTTNLNVTGGSAIYLYLAIA